MRLHRIASFMIMLVMLTCLVFPAPVLADNDIKATIKDPDHPGLTEGNTETSVLSVPTVGVGENQELGIIQITGKAGIDVPVQPGNRVMLTLPLGISYMQEPNEDNYRQYASWPQSIDGKNNQIRDNKQSPGMVFDCSTPHSLILKTGAVDESGQTMVLQFRFDQDNSSKVKVAPFISVVEQYASDQTPISRLDFFRLIAGIAPSRYMINNPAPSVLTMEQKFSDLKDCNPADLEAIRPLVNSSVIRGYKEGVLKPESTISRAEAAALAGRLFGRLGASTGFRDSIPSWGDGAISCARAARLTSPDSDWYFRGDKALSKAEALLILQACFEQKPRADQTSTNVTGQALGF